MFFQMLQKTCHFVLVHLDQPLTLEVIARGVRERVNERVVQDATLGIEESCVCACSSDVPAWIICDQHVLCNQALQESRAVHTGNRNEAAVREAGIPGLRREGWCMIGLLGLVRCCREGPAARKTPFTN